ncbi:uncharacterized protein LOC143462135 [Clavelina lepadiformis]|uniref:Alpha-1,4-N-acetylglucosaminyltransferase n=1 Tax=Clavelina lepadiformis TaxID=159417 RepID=A0ABP0GMS0_CLALP
MGRAMQRKGSSQKWWIREYLFLLIPLCFLLHLISYSVQTAWLLSSVNQRPESFNATELQDFTSALFSGLDNGCQRASSYRNYTVCDHLPYSEIKCGKLAARRDFDENGIKYKVPNIVHLIWLGQPSFRYYNYLAIRSIASIQQPEKIIIHFSSAKPSGQLWEKTEQEIPCLEFEKVTPPSVVLGTKVTHLIAKTDAARIEILLKYGGIYIDGDVITLQNLDHLRKFPITMGRSIKEAISMGVVLSEPNAMFLKKFYQQYPRHYVNSHPFAFTTRYLMTFYRENMKKNWLHIEETSIQRPNPYQEQDGGGSATTLAHFDLSGNYFLHIHPSRAFVTKTVKLKFFTQTDDEMRILDNVYGEAARIALFNMSNLIFKTDEVPHNRVPTENILRFEPIKPLT